MGHDVIGKLVGLGNGSNCVPSDTRSNEGIIPDESATSRFKFSPERIKVPLCHKAEVNPGKSK